MKEYDQDFEAAQYHDVTLESDTIPLTELTLRRAIRVFCRFLCMTFSPFCQPVLECSVIHTSLNKTERHAK